ncbi:MAG: MCE family protein [Planctomycetes bacterium]|nr:MCE family protein [Planctomycetota bacterium]
MNNQALRFRFGLFVLGSLVLLAVLTILFGGFPNYFKRSESFTIVFSNAQGVAPGTPVRRSGVRIGEVRSVELDDATGKVNVGVTIDEKFHLRKGDRPTLIQSLLGGDASIAFVPPDDPKLADPTPVAAGAVLQGVTPADAGTLMQKTGDLVQPALDAVVEIKKTFQSINKMTPIVEDTLKDFQELGKMARSVGPDMQKTSEEIRLLAKSTREDVMPDMRNAVRTWNDVGKKADNLLQKNEDKIVKAIEKFDDALKRINNVLSDENQKNFQDTLKNVKAGSQQLEAIAKDTGELIKDSRGTVKQLNDTLKRADDVLTDLQRTFKPMGDKGPGVIKNFEQAADNLNKTLKDLREIMQVVARSDGTVQRLLSDPALYNNLNDTAIMATKIMPRLDRVLADMEVFADRLARHPELLGVRGAIVPSIGLKQSPSVIPYRIYP